MNVVIPIRAIILVILGSTILGKELHLCFSDSYRDGAVSDRYNVLYLSTEQRLLISDQTPSVYLCLSKSVMIDEQPGENSFLYYQKNPNHKRPFSCSTLYKAGATVYACAESYAIFKIAADQNRLLDQIQIYPRMLLTYFEHQKNLSSNPAVSDVGKDIKKEIVDSVGNEPFWTSLRELTGDKSFTLNNGNTYTTKTRYTYSDDIKLSGTYVDEFFQKQGLKTIRQPYTIGSNAAENIIGIKEGTTKPDEIVVIGGHFDSISQTPTTLAPGAIDDGSGSAGVMVMAEILAKYKFERTIHFVVFSGEEQGLHGSTYYVSQLKNLKWDVKNAILMDMISYSNRYYGVIVEGTPNFRPLMGVLKDNLEEYKEAKFTIKMSEQSYGSDHVPFQRAGIPAILLIEEDDTNYPHYHKNTDTVAHVNMGQTVNIMKGGIGAAVDLIGLAQTKI